MSRGHHCILLISSLLLPACGPKEMVATTIIERNDDSEPFSALSTARPMPGPDADKIAEANLDLGVYYLRLGEFAEALDRLDKALAQRGGNPSLYSVYALVYQGMGRYEEAEQHFHKALRLAPDNPDVKNNYGQFLCSRKRYAEAEEQFQAVAANPFYDSPEVVYINLGVCAQAQGESDRAYDYFQTALSHDAALPEIILSLCELEVRRGEYARAQRRLSSYLELAPHTAKSTWLGVQIEHRLGDKDALASYSLLLRNKFPESKEAAQHRENMQRAGPLRPDTRYPTPDRPASVPRPGLGLHGL